MVFKRTKRKTSPYDGNNYYRLEYIVFVGSPLHSVLSVLSVFSVFSVFSVHSVYAALPHFDSALSLFLILFLPVCFFLLHSGGGEGRGENPFKTQQQSPPPSSYLKDDTTTVQRSFQKCQARIPLIPLRTNLPLTQIGPAISPLPRTRTHIHERPGSAGIGQDRSGSMTQIGPAISPAHENTFRIGQDRSGSILTGFKVNGKKIKSGRYSVLDIGRTRCFNVMDYHVIGTIIMESCLID